MKPCLQTLLANNNHLAFLPGGMTDLSQLRELDCSGNNLLNEFNKHYSGELEISSFIQSYKKVQASQGLHPCSKCGNEQPS
ncbi:MAG: leucine-rich repeat domain-containing protein, partial [Candidatus Kariarchaeaceae archaeon]